MKTSLILSAAAAVALVGCNDANSANGTTTAATGEAIAAPDGTSWEETVSATTEGGFRMGNPDAPVKLIEYGSLSCGACAYFDQNGFPELKEQFIQTGQVSYEFRPFTLNAIDVPAGIVARCAGPERFFPLTHAFYENQAEWAPQVQQALQSPALQGVSREEAIGIIGEESGLVTFAAQRGLPSAKVSECLADPDAAQQLLSIRQKGNEDWEITGTPTFIINGRKAEGAVQWDALQGEIQDALGN